MISSTYSDTLNRQLELKSAETITGDSLGVLLSAALTTDGLETAVDAAVPNENVVGVGVGLVFS